MIFVGHFSNPEKDAVRNFFTINHDLLPRLANFLLNHNNLYKELAHTQQNPVADASFSVKESAITREDLEAFLGRAGADAVGNAYSSNHITTTQDSNDSHTSGEPSNISVECSYSVFPGTREQNQVPPPIRGTYRASSFFASKKSGSIYAFVFPQHFPFGVGHPGQQRRVGISQKEYWHWALQRDDNRFAADPRFLVYLFDQLSTQKALSNFIYI